MENLNTIFRLLFISLLACTNYMNGAVVPAVKCGMKPATVYTSKRIVGGLEAVAGEWPWMVALFHAQGKGPNNKPYFKCGATMLSDRWVVTAAHCTQMTQPKLLSVRLGEHDLSVEDEQYEQNIPVSRVVGHPLFGIGAKNLTTGKIGLYAENDLALLELAHPARIDTRTSPVCVDPGLAGFSEINNKRCYIAGWGNKKLHTATEPRLLHVTVPLVSKEKCNYAKSYGGMITDSMVCAGFEQGGKDTCEGDSGGIEASRVLTVGDSLTKGYFNGGKSFHPYGEKLEGLLNRDDHRCFLLQISGENGEQSDHMLQRLSNYLNTKQKTFNWVLILAGTNDLLEGDRSSDTIADQIIIMHEVVHARGAKSLVITIPELFCERTKCPDIKRKRQSINKRLRKYAAAAGSKAYLSDLALRLSLHQLSVEDRKAFWEPAGVHLKPKGYDKMADVIFKDLMESMESPFA